MPQATRNKTVPLPNGTKVLCYFDREDMSWLHVTDGVGGYLGSIPRTRGARRTDKSALKEQFDSQRKALHDLQAKVSARMNGGVSSRIGNTGDGRVTIFLSTI